jgi:hypothetical protein
MSQNPPTDAARREPADPLDRLLMDFFQSQLKQPWPPAPATPATEPAALVASRETTPSRRDPSRRSRYTLAASVALVLGVGWLFSSGFAPGVRPNSGPAPTGGMLKDAGASQPAAVKELQKDNAIRNGVGKGRKDPPPLQLP